MNKSTYQYVCVYMRACVHVMKNSRLNHEGNYLVMKQKISNIIQ